MLFVSPEAVDVGLVASLLLLLLEGEDNPKIVDNREAPVLPDGSAGLDRADGEAVASASASSCFRLIK